MIKKNDFNNMISTSSIERRNVETNKEKNATILQEIGKQPMENKYILISR